MQELTWSKEKEIKIVKSLLEGVGYKFKHPTLVLDGKDGWFVILTPKRRPFKMLVHLGRDTIHCSDEMVPDFFSTIPELIE